MSMKVFGLNCEHDHRFEGWFASAEAFADQQERKLIECPVCGSHAVRKIPAATRLNLSNLQSPPASQRQGAPAGAAQAAGPAARAAGEQRRAEQAPMTPEQVQAMFMKMTRRILESTEDVGERFAEEARRIHYREAPERAIRGSASRDEAAALREEGIEVYALPLPLAHKGTLQ